MAKKPVEIIGIPSDLGANVRGSNMGPSFLRVAGICDKIKGLGIDVHDTGDIPVPVRETLSAAETEKHYLKTITKICKQACTRTYDALKKGHTPLTIGGEHSLAMGTISGVHQYFSERQESFGLIWVDAHADMNTPTSSNTGNIHGMPLAVLLGEGFPDLVSLGAGGQKLDPKKVALIGIRSIDADEKDIIKRAGIRYFTMREIDERGMHSIMKEAIAIAGTNSQGIHLSFDLDVVDPLYAPGVSTPAMGGLNYRESHLAMEMIADTGILSSMEFVELNPMNDHLHRTADFTVELIQSALGKSIV